MVKQVEQIHASGAVVEYLQTLLARTRDCGQFINGLSPRAGLQWLRAAKALAYVEGRDSVLPDDIKLLASYTAAHRLHCNDGSDSTDALNELVAGVEVL
ncbi:MAG: MoxR-like ATPase [Paracoccaceae bacterium]|jgi:MoxR-like ATPase